MTEELKANIDEYVKDTCLYYRSTHEDVLPNQFEKYLRKACIHFATENGIQWHDLRKDPNDLPKDEGKFITSSYLNLVIRMKGSTYNALAQGKFNFDTKEFEYAHLECLTEVIAWCEIPQFKE